MRWTTESTVTFPVLHEYLKKTAHAAVVGLRDRRSGMGGQE
jgi:hypothetical protein